MDRERIMGICGLVLLVISAIMALIFNEPVMTLSSMLALFISLISVIYVKNRTQRYSLLMSAVMLICTVAIVTVASRETLIEGDVVSETAWMCILGIIRATAVVPMIMVFYFTVASVFKGSYNWFIISVFSPFIGLGMLAPGYASTLYIQAAYIEANVIENTYIVWGLTMGVIVFASLAVVLAYIFRNNRYLINNSGIIVNNAIQPLVKPWDTVKRGDTENGELKASDIKERRIAWGVLGASLLIIGFMYAYVTAGLAAGINSGHPVGYLQATCIMWAIITAMLPALRLLKLVSLPAWFIILVNANMCLYVVSLCQGLYLDVDWWGNLSHQIAAFIVASIVFLALCLMQTYSPPYLTFGSRGGIVAMLILLSASFGCIWEIAEGFTDILSGTDLMVYGIEDTLSDLWADLVGVGIMTTVAWIILGRQSPEQVASMVRIGRNSIDIME